ncbi:hypothetical protein [Haliangium sp.]|uniref:hypothetical protein n=1 Tax=Haliangium sp. TaxID=2663208 RepID=UPI003D137B24
MQSSVLIVSMVGDSHAAAVSWSLSQQERPCSLWCPELTPRLPASLTLCNGQPEELHLGEMAPALPHGPRSVWMRRFTVPRMASAFPPGDQQVARRELDCFLRGLTLAAGAGAFWANPPSAQRWGASQKLVQLRGAHALGIPIPDTLVTNDVEEVKAFIRHSQGQVVYKPFYPAVWRSEAGREQHTMTTVIDEHMLSDPDSLSFCPGIVQRFVPKKCELRVAIFGRTCIAARIDDQDPIDYRTSYDSLQVSPYTLPAAVERSLLDLMDELGLVMGMVDLIVTEAGEYVFLEVNEQGQFLWLEQMCPDIRLLEPFTEFLSSADPWFHWTAPDRPELTFTEFLNSDAYRRFEADTARQRTEYHDLLDESLVVVDSN